MSGYDEFSMLADNAGEVGLPWTGPPAVERRSVALADGRALSALVWGSSEPELVLLHGGAQNAHTWDTVALALDRPLVAVDLPGHGHSDWRDDHDYRPTLAAEDVAAAVSVLAPGAAMVVGMSYGGLTALALAADAPELVGRLVLVDVTPGVDHAKAEPIIEFVSGPESFASFDEILERTMRFNPTRSESSLRRGILHNAGELDDGSWAWRWDPGRAWKDDTATDPSGRPASPDFSGQWDMVSAATVPITLVRGMRESSVVTDDDVEELRRRCPDAEVVEVVEAGHSVQGDQPIELAGILGARLP